MTRGDAVGWCRDPLPFDKIIMDYLKCELQDVRELEKTVFDDLLKQCLAAKNAQRELAAAQLRGR